MLKFKHGLFIFSVFFVCSSVQAMELYPAHDFKITVDRAINQVKELCKKNVDNDKFDPTDEVHYKEDALPWFNILERMLTNVPYRYYSRKRPYDDVLNQYAKQIRPLVSALEGRQLLPLLKRLQEALSGFDTAQYNHVGNVINAVIKERSEGALYHPKVENSDSDVENSDSDDDFNRYQQNKSRCQRNKNRKQKEDNNLPRKLDFSTETRQSQRLMRRCAQQMRQQQQGPLPFVDNSLQEEGNGGSTSFVFPMIQAPTTIVQQEKESLDDRVARLAQEQEGLKTWQIKRLQEQQFSMQQQQQEMSIDPYDRKRQILQINRASTFGLSHDDIDKMLTDFGLMEE